MAWISQVEVSSNEPQFISRTNPIRNLIPEIDDILRAYHDEFSDGEDYTLRLFQRLGEDRVRGFGPDFDEMKKRIGLFVPQKLVEIYGQSRVFTDRIGRKANSRPNNDSQTNTWVMNYTRHQVR